MIRHAAWGTRVGLARLVALLAGGLSTLAFTSSTVSAGAYDPAGVPWRSDLGSAQVEAKEKNQILWLQFTGPWCPNCRRMDRGAFVHPTVTALAREKFVPIKLRSDEFEGLALSLGLSVLPSTVLVRPNGEVINKHEGYADSTEFYAFLQTNLAEEDRRNQAIAAKSKPKSAIDAKGAVALGAYCPVTLVAERRLVPGRPDLSLRFGGAEYRFASTEARDRFTREPLRYLPVNGGASPVCQVDGGDCRPGDPRWSVTYKGHLFLCADRNERELFLLDPERYAHVGEVERARLGDRTSLWALVRPGRTLAPAYIRSGEGEPIALQATRALLGVTRR